MLGRALVFCACFFILSGCTSNEPMPQIVDRADCEFVLPAPPVAKPHVVTPEPGRQHSYEDVPSDWLPPARLEKRWTAIVVHHSATENGNAAIFDRKHREENHWEGVGYDFVIGNGTDSGDGQVEVTFRWRKQMTGAHCGGTPDNWANENGIGICLVGNFDHAAPGTRQLQSLAKLVRFLQERYGIPNGRIYGHNSTPGARVTACPGTRFSMTGFKRMLGSEPLQDRTTVPGG
ncbi:MAG: hypothetical protein A2Z25_21990 [Planctomycetes bacterium RBG_16_55_9]|nr:MAG: hypothetical protein A2Z25_21990 [Planctomycetes bacterium RBG_16_55_9]